MLNENTAKVMFNGNGYTMASTIRKYFLYRCAELTLEKGFTHFVILNENLKNHVEDTGYKTEGKITKNYSGNYDFNGEIQKRPDINRYQSFGTIRMYKVHSAPTNSYNAYKTLEGTEILNNLRLSRNISSPQAKVNDIEIIQKTENIDILSDEYTLPGYYSFFDTDKKCHYNKHTSMKDFVQVLESEKFKYSVESSGPFHKSGNYFQIIKITYPKEEYYFMFKKLADCIYIHNKLHEKQ
jgi:hypothetical protein